MPLKRRYLHCICEILHAAGRLQFVRGIIRLAFTGTVLCRLSSVFACFKRGPISRRDSLFGFD